MKMQKLITKQNTRVALCSRYKGSPCTKFSTRVALVLALCSAVGGLSFAFYVCKAQVMSSSHYSLESDSLNFGGGYSTSTNYIQESTGGEVATGISSSTNYTMNAGYQQMNIVALSFSAAGKRGHVAFDRRCHWRDIKWFDDIHGHDG